ncbi:MAG: FecR domain-containing protein [Acidobacteria bacterium]|nr:FecR domain-containing protein [Acidobacteriota bacterium]MBK8813846.1 FecR domain-containing protein [Acidobacteriota bacterium]
MSVASESGMNNVHYKDQLSGFVNHELTDDQRQNVGEHLLVCPDCRSALDEIRFGAQLARALEQHDPPPEVWERLEARLDKRRAFALFGIFSPAFAGLMFVAVVGIAIAIYFGVSGEGTGGWRIETLAGSTSVGERLGVGQTLETDASSRARLQVADIGNVEIASNSRVKLIDSKSDQYRLSLERGRLSARILAPPRLFIVDTPSAVAVDLGCAYTLDVDENGDSNLHVTSGYVALERDGRDVIVPAGAMAITKKGIGLGTPFADDASDEFRRVLYRIDFENGGREALIELIGKARKDDSISLWHLLRSVPREDRETVFDAMSKFVKLPPDTTRAGILDLDKKMLDALWYQVKIVWFEG